MERKSNGTILAHSWHRSAHQMAQFWHTSADDTQIQPCYNCTVQKWTKRKAPIF